MTASKKIILPSLLYKQENTPLLQMEAEGKTLLLHFALAGKKIWKSRPPWCFLWPFLQSGYNVLPFGAFPPHILVGFVYRTARGIKNLILFIRSQQLHPIYFEIYRHKKLFSSALPHAVELCFYRDKGGISCLNPTDGWFLSLPWTFLMPLEMNVVGSASSLTGP